jgi:uncharacterized protein DUF5134
MTAPVWLRAGVAAIMLAVGAYCAARPAAARRWHRSTQRDADVMHAAMGAAMAGMLLPGLAVVGPGVWAAVFGAGMAWFAGHELWRRDVWRRAPWRRGSAGADGGGGRRGGADGGGHHMAHALSCAAMLAMTALAPGGVLAAGPGAAGTGLGPVLTLGLTVAVAASVVVTADRLTSLAPAPVPAPASQAADRPAPAGTGESPADAPARPVLCPRLAAWCQIAMGIAMAYLLIQML